MSTYGPLSIKDLARRWGVSVRTIERMKANGQLPVVCFASRVVRFLEADIVEFEKAHRTTPNVSTTRGGAAQ